MKRYLVLPAALILVLCLFSADGYHNEETHVFSEAIDNYPPPSSTVISKPPENHSDTYSNTTDIIPAEDELAETDLRQKSGSDSPPPTETPAPENTPIPEKNEPTPNWYENKEKGMKVPILMYHNLLEGSAKGDELNVSQETFDDQMYHLKVFGYTAITFKDLYNHYMYGSSLPENPIIITFDDGYHSNYSIGYPILKKYGLNACIFVITNTIGRGNYMTEAEIKEISDSGIIEIQCHSVTHSFELSSMDKKSMAYEVAHSKSTLEAITNKEINIFCYPFGKYSRRLIQELRDQQFIFSVTTINGLASKSTNPLLLPRIRVMGSESGEKLKNKIEKATGRPTVFVGIPEPPLPAEPGEAQLPPEPTETPPPEPTETPPPPEPEEIPPPSEPEETPPPSEPQETPPPSVPEETPPPSVPEETPPPSEP